MAEQFTGDNAEIYYKIEEENGVLPTDAANDGQTTLTAAVDPGAASIVVASVAGIAAGNIIAVGSNSNREIVRIKTVTAGQKKLTLDEATPLNFRHSNGEAVSKTDPTNDWFGLGSVTAFTPRSDRPLDSSAALGGGVRGIKNVVSGRYDFGVDITVEFDIKSAPLWFLHALNDNYISTGTAVAPAVATTLGGAAAKAATDFVVANVAGLEVGDFLEIDGKEVVKIEAVTAGTKTIEVSDASSPLGLRYAHANGVAVKKVEAPFTHTIVKGRGLPAGMSLLLKLQEGDQRSLILLTGNRINTLSLSASGDTTIPTLTINTVAARGQVLSKDIFGDDATKIAHTPYAQWEAEVSAGDAENRFNSLSLEIANNVTAGAPLGSALPGAVSAGEGAVTGSFEYEYRTQGFTRATALGTVRELNFNWLHQLDPDYSLKIQLPETRFGGAAHPPVPGKGPLPDSKEFTAVVNSATNTDIKIVAKTKNPSVEYLTEAA